MKRTYIKSYRYKIGKNHYIVLQIHQMAAATADSGNVLASNAVNVKIFKGGSKPHAKKTKKNSRR